MPTYDYRCTACGHQFDRFESITSEPNKLCPKCKKKKAERRISGGGGFLFKGSGFYVTDYRKSSSSTSKSEPAACPKAEPESPKCACCPSNKKKAKAS